MLAPGSSAPPCPRSPPRYLDFCGRHRLPVEVQILDREIGFLEEELQSLEGLQSVSRCCKEINELVGTNPDPLIPLNKKKHKSCSIWERLRAKLCFNFSCCSCICSRCPERLSCACHQQPKKCCCTCWEVSCRRRQCRRPNLPCPECSCGCVWSLLPQLYRGTPSPKMY